jgi:hypothetical protein
MKKLLFLSAAFVRTAAILLLNRQNSTNQNTGATKITRTLSKEQFTDQIIYMRFYNPQKNW